MGLRGAYRGRDGGRVGGREACEGERRKRERSLNLFTMWVSLPSNCVLWPRQSLIVPGTDVRGDAVFFEFLKFVKKKIVFRLYYLVCICVCVCFLMVFRQ